MEEEGEDVSEVGLVGRGRDVVDEGIDCFVARVCGRDWTGEPCGRNSGSSSITLKRWAAHDLAGAVLGTVSFSGAKGLDAEALLLGTKRDRERERLLEGVVSDRRPVAVAVLL